MDQGQRSPPSNSPPGFVWAALAVLAAMAASPLLSTLTVAAPIVAGIGADVIATTLEDVRISAEKMFASRPTVKAADVLEWARSHGGAHGLRVACDKDRDLPDATRIIERVAKLTRLFWLDMSDCRIGDTGAAALAEALQSLPYLCTLELSRCGLSSEGTVSVVRALKHVKRLEHVDLLGNGIDDAGEAALAAAFLHLPRLKHFSLGRTTAYKSLAEEFRRLYPTPIPRSSDDDDDDNSDWGDDDDDSNWRDDDDD